MSSPTATATRLPGAITAVTVSGRLWLYSNYHCNLACAYCLTESAPRVPRRELAGNRMEQLTEQAGQLGFTGLGVTSGEPFLRGELPELLGKLAGWLPVVGSPTARCSPAATSRTGAGYFPLVS